EIAAGRRVGVREIYCRTGKPRDVIVRCEADAGRRATEVQDIAASGDLSGRPIAGVIPVRADGSGPIERGRRNGGQDDVVAVAAGVTHRELPAAAADGAAFGNAAKGPNDGIGPVVVDNREGAA